MFVIIATFVTIGGYYSEPTDEKFSSMAECERNIPIVAAGARESGLVGMNFGKGTIIDVSFECQAK